MKRITHTLILIALAVSFTSCATKVQAHRIAPARFPVAGIKKIAVADFEARGWHGSHWASAMSRSLSNDLDAHDFYEVVAGAPEVGADAPAGAGTNPSWRRWGRENGADGILAGTVKDADVRRSWDTRRVTEMIHTGRYRDRVRIEGGEVRKHREEIVRTETRYIPVVHKYARVSVAVALLDVRTGERLAYEEYSDSMSRSAEGEMRIGWMPEAEEMMGYLVDRISTTIVRDMVPHLVSEKIRIEQDKACAEGNKLARQDDWDGAEREWKRVVADDPGNHVGWYNLGVAAEISKRYGEAVSNYQRAADLSNKKLYLTALERSRKRWQDKQKLDKQMEGRQP